MTGNTIGQCFSVTTFGESHGPALGAVVDGCPPGLPLDESDIQPDLDRRRPGQSRFTTQRRETDQVRILSGVFEGVTTGSPIGLLIDNVDQRSKDYSDIAEMFRPGHADYTYLHKYGLRDFKGGGRSSARETALRVAAGAIARKYLWTRFHTQVRGCLIRMGKIAAKSIDWSVVNTNPFFSPDLSVIDEMERSIDALRRKGDSCGAMLLVTANGLPPGWGEPVFGRLDADIGAAMLSINAVKGVEIGAGFKSVEQLGSEHRDEISPQGFLSNNAGGVLGGISTGQELVVRIAVKPTSSITTPGRTVNYSGDPVEVVTKGRHDPCVGIRATPIAEAMLALVLVDHALRHRAQNQDVQSNAPIIPAGERLKRT